MSLAKLSAEAVHALAKLAHLTMPAEEEAQACADLRLILQHMATLVETSPEEPMDVVARPLDAQTPRWREDVVVASLPIERVLANAPERLGDGFGVPKIVE